MTQTLWGLLLFLLLNGCTQENKHPLSMDDLLKMPTEELMNLPVKNLDQAKMRK